MGDFHGYTISIKFVLKDHVVYCFRLTFTFVLLNSDGVPLSGAESLSLLKQKDSINKLKDSGFIISDFSLVVNPKSSSESLPMVQTSSLQSMLFFVFLGGGGGGGGHLQLC